MVSVLRSCELDISSYHTLLTLGQVPHKGTGCPSKRRRIEIDFRGLRVVFRHRQDSCWWRADLARRVDGS